MNLRVELKVERLLFRVEGVGNTGVWVAFGSQVGLLNEAPCFGTMNIRARVCIAHVEEIA